MTSKEDDTLPLPALSLEYSVDVTADEDIIPTSQPLNVSPKVPKTSDVSSDKSTEKQSPSKAAPQCAIDDTLPRGALMDQTTFDKDKSSDFIPDTETKKVKVTHVKDEPSCRRKLRVFPGDDTCQPQSVPLWETQGPQVPETPALDFPPINGSPESAQRLHEKTYSKCDKSIAEILVNDSAETVDLESSPMRAMKTEDETKTEKLSGSCSIGSDVERCEETQIFDNSSVVLLEQSGSLMADGGEKSTKAADSSQQLYLIKTIEDESDLREQNLIAPPPAVAQTSRTFLVKNELVDSSSAARNAIPVEEDAAGQEESVVMTRKIDFKLTVTCLVSFNVKTNQVLQKCISQVNESSKTQLKPSHVDHLSDNVSDKSKRYSTSSSGSVYSDKLGLPFALPKRVSAVSDQTDSSEDDMGVRMRKKDENLKRTPWSNEYLLPLKLDELVQFSIESQQILERPAAVSSSFREARNCLSAERRRLKQTVQSSTCEPPSVRQSGRKATSGDGEESPGDTEKAKEDGSGDRKESSGDAKAREDSSGDRREVFGEVEQSAPSGEAKEGQTGDEDKSSVVLGAGVPVLARWTDKRYYSGLLCGSPKNDRWDVRFDDGTLKTVREDMIMPTEWLKRGSLVFALVDDKYESGQITHIEKGKEVTYTIELDVKKRKVSVRASDLRLTDVMAGIIREKYKPLAGTPRGAADIDFENVLSGKRLREQRTPLRPVITDKRGSSESKKKSSSKRKAGEDRALETIEETPEARSSGKRPPGLRSEGGHLVEDKVASAESPSGNEAGTPLRRASKETRGKARPRTLSYEAEETRYRKGKSKSWLAPDGTPIPGPSGVKFKKKKSQVREDESDEPAMKKAVGQERSLRSRVASSATPESSKKKRRLEGLEEENVEKKLAKRGEVRTKTKSRKV